MRLSASIEYRNLIEQIARELPSFIFMLLFELKLAFKGSFERTASSKGLSTLTNSPS